ncbi:hypothetical protein [Curtobacterium sp. MCBD17_040]|uniref:hypothetical protein n=1 Tax=Curtobacterium sp. MCBD17_040 TaxID=2175674 RepID=UPI000DAA3905|nr:hypothetical protein [Curtobacterium sp. MCBD17_040]WIB64132.1 hypothetical protein DEI94_02740 [Curtobacterium sp. MCBD17_040]
MHAGDLSAALWNERALLERLVGAIRTARPAAECDAVLEDLRAVRLVRDVHLATVLRDLHRAEDAGLSALLEPGLPAPWNLILPEHVTAIRALAAEIDAQERGRPGAAPARWPAFAAAAGYR